MKRALAFHPRAPRLATLRLLRELYLMDLVQLALLPGTPGELKRGAENQLVARLPQLPLGQKITLARRGPARVAGALLAEGHKQIVTMVLDNAHLTEAQILKVLSREKLPLHVIHAVSQHRKWSRTYNVRLALVRHPGSTLSTVLSYLPELTVSDLSELAAAGVVPEISANTCEPRSNAESARPKSRPRKPLPLATPPRPGTTNSRFSSAGEPAPFFL